MVWIFPFFFNYRIQSIFMVGTHSMRIYLLINFFFVFSFKLWKSAGDFFIAMGRFEKIIKIVAHNMDFLVNFFCPELRFHSFHIKFFHIIWALKAVLCQYFVYLCNVIILELFLLFLLLTHKMFFVSILYSAVVSKKFFVSFLILIKQFF